MAGHHPIQSGALATDTVELTTSYLTNQPTLFGALQQYGVPLWMNGHDHVNYHVRRGPKSSATTFMGIGHGAGLGCRRGFLPAARSWGKASPPPMSRCLCGW